MKQGRLLEKLIETLERVLANHDNILIESPKRLPDKITGKLREHDVVLTVNQSHHQLLIAIECRDLSRPITVNQVEGFWAKCQHTGINQGAIVSQNGFSMSACKKAENLGIRCLDIEQVSSFNWLLTNGITVYRRNILNVNLIVIPHAGPKVNIDNFVLVDNAGNVFTSEILLKIVQNIFSQLELNPNEFQKDPGIDNIKMKLQGDGVYIRNNHNVDLIPVEWLIANVEYELISEFSEFNLIKYSDRSQGIELIDAAIGKIRLGDNESGQLLIAYKNGEGGKIIYLGDR